MQRLKSWNRAVIAAAGLLACTNLPAEQKQAPISAPAPGCSAAEYRQFDFWLGQWQVTEAGQSAGRNEIQLDLSGCALFESWTSLDNMRGRSVNFYDRRRHRWHQTWIDDHGGSLQLEGGIVNGSTVLEQRQADSSSGRLIVNRITWMPNADGSVRQHWEVMKRRRAAWETVFDGLYVRTRPPAAPSQ